MRIPLINAKHVSNIEQISVLMDTLPKSSVSHQPWLKFKSNSQTSFVIAHSGDKICLKFYVSEDVIKVNTYQTNGSVHKDNCVEFFVSFGSDKKYYNIEFNCVGTCLIGYGEQRENRILLDNTLIEKIKKHIKIITAPINSSNRFGWEITAIIPIEVFQNSNLTRFNKIEGAGNFFKCGDDLPNPHYYCWNIIKSETPNFHLPEFFGSLKFE